MKLWSCLLLFLVLLAGSLNGVAVAERAETDVYCAEQDFSTRCDARYTAQWEEDNGLRIWLDGPGYVPNVLIFRRSEAQKVKDPVNYLNNVYREYMEEKYGDSVVTEPCRQADAYGRHLYAACYHYEAKGNRLCLMRAVEIREDGDVEYAAKYPEGELDEALQALNLAIQYYRVGQAASGAPTQASDPSPAPTRSTDTGVALNVTPAQPLVSGVAAYQDGRFHMNLPNGWQVLTQSDYAYFCLKAWDPASPNRSIFLFMKAEPFLKSQAEKAYYRKLAGGDASSVYGPYAEAPVMESCTLEALLKCVPQIRDYCDLYYDVGLTVSSAVLPEMTDVEVLEKKPSTLPAPSDCKENMIERIAYSDYRGQRCEGLVTGQPRDPGSYYMGSVDTMTYSVNLFMGVTAPAGELEELEPILADCLGSFGFEERYVRQAVDHSNAQTQALREQLRQIEAAHDALMQAWYAREEAHDIAFQKLSDSIMGYDRLYDSATGEVYRADVGFYDSYNLNRSDYGNPNLQRIDSGSQQYYLQGVDYYITR